MKSYSETCAHDLNDVVELVTGSLEARAPGERGTCVTQGLLDTISQEMLFLRGSSTKPSLIIPNLVSSAGFRVNHPYNKAAFALSLAVEDYRDQRPSYHNDRHAIEVAVAAYILGRRQKLPANRLAELLLAATAHDLGHEGKNNLQPFEWEERAVNLCAPILRRAGLRNDAVERVGHMIRGTDFKNGVPLVRAEYRKLQGRTPGDSDLLLATQRLLLIEADVFFSCFDIHYNQLLSQLLSVEWQRPGPNLNARERAGFLSSVEFLSSAALELGLEERRMGILQSLDPNVDAA